MSQGSHLGALGALINNIEHFIRRDGNVAAASNSAADDETATTDSNDAASAAKEETSTK